MVGQSGNQVSQESAVGPGHERGNRQCRQFPRSVEYTHGGRFGAAVGDIWDLRPVL